MSQYWFKPKAYGYGATPTTWEGWLATAAYGAVVLAITVPLLVAPAEIPSGAKLSQVVTWAILLALLTIGFIRITRAKTDGQWRWRWGK
jgi:hypothetical protein